MRGVALKAVQELLGHATIELTIRCSHLALHVALDAVWLLYGDSGKLEQVRFSLYLSYLNYMDLPVPPRVRQKP